MQPRTLRTRRGVRRGLLLALAVSATVALALPMPGLAARQDTDPTKWAQGVCSAIVDWSGAAETRANALGKQMSGGGLPQARAVLSRFLDQMVQETDRMITRIDVYGTPGVKNGTPIRQRLRTLMAAARASLAQGRRDAAKLSITDATANQRQRRQAVRRPGEGLRRSRQGLSLGGAGQGRGQGSGLQQAVSALRPSRPGPRPTPARAAIPLPSPRAKAPRSEHKIATYVDRSWTLSSIHTGRSDSCLLPYLSLFGWRACSTSRFENGSGRRS